jgi:hypothetical protein
MKIEELAQKLKYGFAQVPAPFSTEKALYIIVTSRLSIFNV